MGIQKLANGGPILLAVIVLFCQFQPSIASRVLLGFQRMRQLVEPILRSKNGSSDATKNEQFAMMPPLNRILRRNASRQAISSTCSMPSTVNMSKEMDMAEMIEKKGKASEENYGSQSLDETTIEYLADFWLNLNDYQRMQSKKKMMCLILESELEAAKDSIDLRQERTANCNFQKKLPETDPDIFENNKKAVKFLVEKTILPLNHLRPKYIFGVTLLGIKMQGYVAGMRAPANANQEDANRNEDNRFGGGG